MSEFEAKFLDDVAEILFRQVSPFQWADGIPSSEAFKPSDRDSGLLSTLRESVGAQEAYRRWTEDFGFCSVGTFGISVKEVHAEGLNAIDDEEATQPDHASVDFSTVATKGQRKQKSRRLRDAAVGRGCLHSPNTSN